MPILQAYIVLACAIGCLMIAAVSPFKTRRWGLLCLIFAAPLAAGEVRPPGPIPPNVTYHRQNDGVWIFERKGSELPNFWQTLLDLFNWRSPGPLPFRRSVAFLTGVGQYSHISPQLEFVASDLTDVRNYLLTAGGFDKVFEARDAVVTRTLIEDYMANKFSIRGAELSPDDRLLFYYSGHGADQQGRIGYLLFSNAAPDNFAGDNVLPLREFQSWSETIVAKHLLIVLDSCASGLAVQQKGEDSGQALVNALSGEGSGYLLTAGTAEQRAYQLQIDSKAGYSVFTRALLDALRNGLSESGLMTINEVFGRAQQFVGRFAVEQGKKMDPQIWPMNRAHGEAAGTFVFVDPNRRKPRLPSDLNGVLTVAKGAPEAGENSSRIDLMKLEFENLKASHNRAALEKFVEQNESVPGAGALVELIKERIALISPGQAPLSMSESATGRVPAGRADFHLVSKANFGVQYDLRGSYEVFGDHIYFSVTSGAATNVRADESIVTIKSLGLGMCYQIKEGWNTMAGHNGISNVIPLEGAQIRRGTSFNFPPMALKVPNRVSSQSTRYWPCAFLYRSDGRYYPVHDDKNYHPG